MNIDPETGKNYGLPPTADDVRNFAAELDDRDEATQEELDMLRLVANRIEVLEKERDEARRMACEKEETLGCDERGVPRNGSARDHAKQRGWDCFKDNP